MYVQYLLSVNHTETYTGVFFPPKVYVITECACQDIVLNFPPVNYTQLDDDALHFKFIKTLCSSKKAFDLIHLLLNVLIYFRIVWSSSG